MKHNRSVIFNFAECIASVILVLSFVFFLLRLLGGYTFYHPFYNYSITDCFTVMLAAMTMFATINEYNSHRDRIKAEVLGQYNERYSNDEHINKVVPYLIADIMNLKTEMPSVHDFEIFMRFFEEIELQIEKNRLEEKAVYDLFAYYALYLDSKPQLINIVDDYNSANWGIFLKFIERMAKNGFLNTLWKPDNDKRVEIQFDNDGNMIIYGKSIPYTYQEGKIKCRIYSREIEIKHILSGKNKLEELEYEGKIYTQKND